MNRTLFIEPTCFTRINRRINVCVQRQCIRAKHELCSVKVDTNSGTYQYQRVHFPFPRLAVSCIWVLNDNIVICDETEHERRHGSLVRVDLELGDCLRDLWFAAISAEYRIVCCHVLECYASKMNWLSLNSVWKHCQFSYKIPYQFLSCWKANWINLCRSGSGVASMKPPLEAGGI